MILKIVTTADQSTDQKLVQELNIQFPNESKFCVILGRLFKIHPYFDDAIINILFQSPQYTYIIYIAERTNFYWNEVIYDRLKKRCQQLLGEILYSHSNFNSGLINELNRYPGIRDAIIGNHINITNDDRSVINSLVELLMKRVRFLHFYRYVWIITSKHTRVALDTFPYGGCLTSHDALSNSIPMVTLPSDYVRGRYTYAMYHQMNHTDLIAHNISHYVDLVIQLLTNDSFYETQISLIQLKYKENFHKNHLVAHEWIKLMYLLISRKLEYLP